MAFSAEDCWTLASHLIHLLHERRNPCECFASFAPQFREVVLCDQIVWIGFTPRFFGTFPKNPNLHIEDVGPSWWQEQSQVQEATFATLPFPLDDRLRQQGSPYRAYFPLTSANGVVGLWVLAGKRPLSSEERHFLAELSPLLAFTLQRSTDSLSPEAQYLRDELKSERDLRPLTGDSQGMKHVRRSIQQVAGTDSTVLLRGETGTGKELVARAIHQLSPRRDRLLVKVNCAALGPQIITSELFGHEQGAFTGATRRRIGRFELAHQGTLFLDEIGEVSAETQVLLLRVLQERVIERVGGQEPIAVDVRIIAATNRDLEKAVQAGEFRADLFYRLNVFPLALPPLRERREDIPSLVQHFVQLFARRLNRQVTGVAAGSLDMLKRYAWPGNVRELENVIERALIVCPGPVIDIDPTWLASPRPPTDEPTSLAERERQTIVEALERCRGRIYGPKGAAAALGLKPSTFYGKMRRHHIPRQEES